MCGEIKPGEEAVEGVKVCNGAGVCVWRGSKAVVVGWKLYSGKLNSPIRGIVT